MTAKRVYFFSGSQYVRFDSAINNVPGGYPRDIGPMWGGLPDNIGAAFYRGKGRAYFFSGNQYYRYTVLRNAVDPGYPKPIAGNWPGMSDIGFDSDLDAAVNWGNGKVYFFKGNQYCRYDLPSDKVDSGYPKPIDGNWPNISGTGFGSGIDAAINYGNGKVYFFKGGSYVRLDLTSKAVDTGYPKTISGNWPGVYTGGIDSALEWPYAEVAPGGFNVPTARSGCKTVPAAGGLRKMGEEFRMELDFQEPAHPVTCAVGEYRQYVRGSFVINGTAIAHGLPNPAGGPPLTMLPAPAPGAAADNFLEDGLPTPPAGMNVFYGHRIDVAGNSDPTDQYLADRMEGCQYRGTDFPGYRDVPGTVVAVALDFRGDAVDRATGNEVLQSTAWSVNCSGTL